MRKPRSSRVAFTLTEILVVIVLIAVLTAFLLPAVIGAHRRARDAACRAEIQSLEMAVDAFFNDFGFYPPTGFAFNPASGEFDSDVFGPDYAYNEALVHCLTNRFVRGSGDEINEFGVMDLDRIKGFGRIIGGAPVNSGPYFDCRRSDLIDLDNDGYFELPDPWGNLYLYIPRDDYLRPGANGEIYNAGALKMIDFDGDDIIDLPDLYDDPLDFGYYHYQRFRFQLISRGEDGWTPGMDHSPNAAGKPKGYLDISIYGNPYGYPPSATEFNPALVGTDTDLSNAFIEGVWGHADETADDINNWSQ